MAKIVPLTGKFQDMRSLLARIMEDEHAVEFCGVVMRDDGECVPVVFGMSRERLAYCGVVLMNISQEPDDE